jgi:hypothetical protein
MILKRKTHERYLTFCKDSRMILSFEKKKIGVHVRSKEPGWL